MREKSVFVGLWGYCLTEVSEMKGSYLRHATLGGKSDAAGMLLRENQVGEGGFAVLGKHFHHRFIYQQPQLQLPVLQGHAHGFERAGKHGVEAHVA